MSTASNPISASANRNNGWLVTGATGLVGRFVLLELLNRGLDVCVLARDRGRWSAADRVEAILQCWEQDNDRHLIRPRVINASLGSLGLDIDVEIARRLAGRYTNLLHCAASVRFEMDAQGIEPLKSNIDGTRNLIQFAESIGVENFHHVSTAYVCGFTDEAVPESPTASGTQFRNPYEYSKAASEALVQNADAFQTKTIYRPSIVIGRHRDGWANAFHTLYSGLRFARELNLDQDTAIVNSIASSLGFSGEETSNIVPVDWVAAAIANVIDQPSTWNQTFHLTHPEPVRIASIIDSIVAAAKQEWTAWNAIPSLTATSVQSNTSETESAFRLHLATYANYFTADPTFLRDNIATIERATSLDSPPPIDEAALTRAFAFAIRQKFSDCTGLGSEKPDKRLLAWTDALNYWDHECASDVQSTNNLQITIAGVGGGLWQLSGDAMDWLADLARHNNDDSKFIQIDLPAWIVVAIENEQLSWAEAFQQNFILSSITLDESCLVLEKMQSAIRVFANNRSADRQVQSLGMPKKTDSKRTRTGSASGKLGGVYG